MATSKRSRTRTIFARPRVPGLLTLILGMPLLTGCQLPPSHQEQVDMREREFEASIGHFQRLEKDRLDEMGRTLSFLEGKHREDIANTRDNADRFEQWIQDDFGNWNRSLPRHEQRIREYMRGRPEKAERVLPLILY